VQKGMMKLSIVIVIGVAFAASTYTAPAAIIDLPVHLNRFIFTTLTDARRVSKFAKTATSFNSKLIKRSSHGVPTKYRRQCVDEYKKNITKLNDEFDIVSRKIWKSQRKSEKDATSYEPGKSIVMKFGVQNVSI
jgi:hypothetical protein